jgi:fructokinase
VSYVLVGIGEILWDILPTGKQMGGAPANFAYHGTSLGEEGIIVSCVGKDELGTEILKHLEDLGLSSNFVASDELHPTGTVSVDVDQAGVPTFTIHKNVSWDFLPMEEAFIALAKRAEAVCFGSLAQRSPTSSATIGNFLQNTLDETLRILDINLRYPFYSQEIIEGSLEKANVLKLNEDELEILSITFSLEGDDRSKLFRLLECFDLEMVALTQGSNGSSLCYGDQISIHPGYPVDVVDTVGAGDAFTAALAIGMLRGFELDRLNDLANQVASYVCTQPGATPPIPRRIRENFRIARQTSDSGMNDR